MSSPTNAIWMEICGGKQGHGGEGWELGECIWSPALSRYSVLEFPEPGELVLHYYKGFYSGRSFVKNKCCEVSHRPPAAGNWGFSSSYFRIDLQDYAPYPKPMHRHDFFKRFGEKVLAEINAGRPKRYPFIIQCDELRTTQGQLLTVVTPNLLEIFREALELDSSFFKQSVQS